MYLPWPGLVLPWTVSLAWSVPYDVEIGIISAKGKDRRASLASCVNNFY